MNNMLETDVALRAAEVHATPDPGDGQRGDRVSFDAADRDFDTGRVDIVAGSEFVDDRIREAE